MLNRSYKKSLAIIACIIIILCKNSYSQNYYLFIGTYTGGQPGKGIYIYKFNSVTGNLVKASTGNNLVNPSWISVSPDGNYLYACTETKTKNDGNVSAFAFDNKKGTMKFLNKQSAGGENPVYISVNQNGKWLVTANYTGGNASVMPINDDGSVKSISQLINYSDSSINKERQDQSHVHAAVFSPDFKYIFITDLGADKIRSYKIDTSAAGKPLTPNTPAYIITTPGSGPRHLMFHPNGNFVYVIEELSSTVSVYKYSNGNLEPVQRIAAHDTADRVSLGSADIHVSPDGKFLYASNRGDKNTIAIFSIDEASGELTALSFQLTHGESPRNFIIDPTGNFLIVANAGTGNIIVFKRDVITGLLTRTKNEIHIPGPSCLQLMAIDKE